MGRRVWPITGSPTLALPDSGWPASSPSRKRREGSRRCRHEHRMSASPRLPAEQRTCWLTSPTRPSGRRRRTGAALACGPVPAWAVDGMSGPGPVQESRGNVTSHVTAALSAQAPTLPIGPRSCASGSARSSRGNALCAPTTSIAAPAARRKARSGGRRSPAARRSRSSRICWAGLGCLLPRLDLARPPCDALMGRCLAPADVCKAGRGGTGPPLARRASTESARSTPAPHPVDDHPHRPEAAPQPRAQAGCASGLSHPPHTVRTITVIGRLEPSSRQWGRPRSPHGGPVRLGHERRPAPGHDP